MSEKKANNLKKKLEKMEKAQRMLNKELDIVKLLRKVALIKKTVKKGMKSSHWKIVKFLGKNVLNRPEKS